MIQPHATQARKGGISLRSARCSALSTTVDSQPQTATLVARIESVMTRNTLPASPLDLAVAATVATVNAKIRNGEATAEYVDMFGVSALAYSVAFESGVSSRTIVAANVVALASKDEKVTKAYTSPTHVCLHATTGDILRLGGDAGMSAVRVQTIAAKARLYLHAGPTKVIIAAASNSADALATLDAETTLAKAAKDAEDAANVAALNGDNVQTVDETLNAHVAAIVAILGDGGRLSSANVADILSAVDASRELVSA